MLLAHHLSIVYVLSQFNLCVYLRKEAMLEAEKKHIFLSLLKFTLNASENPKLPLAWSASSWKQILSFNRE